MQNNSNHLEFSKCWKGPADASREEKLFALDIWCKEISEVCKTPLPRHHLLLPQQAAFQHVWQFSTGWCEVVKTKAQNNMLHPSIQLGSKENLKSPKDISNFCNKKFPRMWILALYLPTPLFAVCSDRMLLGKSNSRVYERKLLIMQQN